MHTVLPYEYKNLPIPGGGYVTGFLFSKQYPDTLYIRTDIGGTYCFDYKKENWNILISHVTMLDLSETYPIAIALDEECPDRLFTVCGMHTSPTGVFAISEDRGSSFTYKTIPTPVHGNWGGRGTGYRLIKDTSAKDTLYFASQKGGLLRTTDLGDSWEELSVNEEKLMTFVWASPDGNTLVVGTAGTTHTSGHMRGHSLYVSYDRGDSFAPLPMPANVDIPDTKLAGLVAQRCDYDGTYLYITCSVNGRRSFIIENGYSCDSGDALGGKVLRYAFDENGKISGYEDITPDASSTFLEYGFSAISSCKSKPGMVACSTICKDDGDMIFVSYDYGQTWEVKLYGLSIGRMDFKAPYMRPCCNGGRNLIHWLSDLKVNPFRPDEVWFNSGTGVFVSHNFTDDTAVFADCCAGLEETVHLNIYSLPAGEVQVIDIVGDLGGFAFRNLDEPCDNSFADDAGNRYITCINADFSDAHPETVIVTPRGNWTGETKGGLILSHDQCKSFERLPMPFGLSDKIDTLLTHIEQPNVNSGWVAMSPDCRNIVWSIADRHSLPMDAVVCSQNGGRSFKQVQIKDVNGCAMHSSGGSTGSDEANMNACPSGGLKVFADRVNSNLFYGFGTDSHIYISKDGGASFTLYETPADFPKLDLGLLFTHRTEIRAESGKEGVLYLALNEHGLYKMVYDKFADCITFTKLTGDGDEVYRFGLGLLREGGDYITEDKAFYICGIIDGHYGFHRSLDGGTTWQQLNTDKQMFGEINSIDGDCRIFGRFYIATGSMGALYGDVRG